MYSIYLHEEAKKELQSKDEKQVNEIIGRMDSLQRGEWKGGTRVKKLRALNHRIVVYEARINKADRMLFSFKLIGQDERNQVAKKTGIFIFRLSVEHDKVIRTAKGLFGEEYEFEEYGLETKEDSIKSLVEKEQVSLEEQTWFHSYIDELKFYEMDDDEWLRIMEKPRMTPEELLEFRLRLNPEQKKILSNPLPLLVAGTAGSGKTTIFIHKLIIEPATKKKIYLTYSEQLCRDC